MTHTEKLYEKFVLVLILKGLITSLYLSQIKKITIKSEKLALAWTLFITLATIGLISL